MKIIIVGAIAAGTSVAAKLIRESKDAEITLYEKTSHVSYSKCGMPYYLSHETDDLTDILPRSPEDFRQQYKVGLHVEHEVINVNAQNKTVTVKNLATGDIFDDAYDKLVLATGSTAIQLPIEGAELNDVAYMRSAEDMFEVDKKLETLKPKTALIVGTGFIGLEMAETLTKRDLKVTMVTNIDILSHLDREFTVYMKAYLEGKGVSVKLNTEVVKIDETTVTFKDGTQASADFVLMAVGTRPNTQLAQKIGLEIGLNRAIAVDQYLETSTPDIYACGDCIEMTHLLSSSTAYIPLGTTANKTGRLLGINLAGGKEPFRGILGTSIFKVFDLQVASTGLSERNALKEGKTIVVGFMQIISRPEFSGGKRMLIKIIAEKDTEKLLGAQIIGFDGVDKRIDVFATAITFGATTEDLIHLDLSYAPPFNIVKDPVQYAGMMMKGLYGKNAHIVHPDGTTENFPEGDRILNVYLNYIVQQADCSLENHT